MSVSEHTEIESLLAEQDHPITILANAAAYIFSTFDRLNWAGFYLYDGSKLILGPFCGKPACTEIPIGSGVCGTSAKKRETIVVADVDTFEGHIACDSASRSEIVVPMIGSTGALIGVLDIDSPELDRFSNADKIAFEHIRDIIVLRLADRLRL